MIKIIFNLLENCCVVWWQMTEMCSQKSIHKREEFLWRILFFEEIKELSLNKRIASVEELNKQDNYWIQNFPKKMILKEIDVFWLLAECFQESVREIQSCHHVLMLQFTEIILHFNINFLIISTIFYTHDLLF